MAQAMSISEIDAAVAHVAPERRAHMLGQVTDLFVLHAASFSDHEIELFDDVISRLAADIEVEARVLLAQRLAVVPKAPHNVIRMLAFDDDVDVATPVLTHSERLDEASLVENARTKSQKHLFAISRRRALREPVTDVLVERGDRSVAISVAGNAGARFSETGYSGMVAHADRDDELTEILGLRIDLPLQYLRELLRRATDAVRARLALIAPAELQEEIKRILKTIAGAAGGDAPATRDFSRAEALVKLLKEHNELDEAAIIKFAETRKFDEVAASLAILNSVPTEMMARVLEGPRSDLVLIPCKPAGLSWPAVETILSKRPLQHPISEATLKLACKDYDKLSTETAQRTLRFWQVHNKLEK